MLARDRWNTVRWQQDGAGHYESWFVRANAPNEPRAFWIRYTIFSPRGRPDDAVGELWAIAFDRKAGRIVAAKSVVPIRDCQFSDKSTDLTIGSASLDAGRVRGWTTQGDVTLRWDMRCHSEANPLLLLPAEFYDAPFPKAKAVVPQPHARFDGTLVVDGEVWKIDRWIGSQNHNWGSKHTDYYAWGQVVGFDDAPDAFLECATVRLKLGPLWTPPLTVAVLRLPDTEIRLNTWGQAVRARGRIEGLKWTFRSRRAGVELDARFEAKQNEFVGLVYGNPPGGSKTCLNSKVARCHLTVRRPGHATLELSTDTRAAFEILTDDPDPNIPVVA